MLKMTGIDHTAAPVEIRSVFTFRQQEMIDLMTTVREQAEADGVVLLTTCNRTELYVSGCGQQTDLLSLLCGFKQIPAADYEAYFTQRADDEAISHLFALTAGLKSAIVAEDQILTQVGEALVFSREHGFADRTLELLFRHAVSAAKQVKTQVAFTHANRTAIDEALDQLARSGFHVSGKKCMVIGNGEYGRLAAQTMMAQGADVTMTIRQYHSGMVLIPDGCRKILYGEKMTYFPQCDLVISATKSPNYTLFYEQVVQVKPDHPMILIDFAVPHDIDPRIRELDGYRIYTVDDFQAGSGGGNEEAYEKAREILSEAQLQLGRRLNRDDLLPQISRIGACAAADARFRLRRDVKKLPVSAAQQEALQERAGDVTGKIVEKLLFRLRDRLDEETLRECIGILDDACARDALKYTTADPENGRKQKEETL